MCISIHAYNTQGFHIACDEYGKVIVFDSTGKINVTYVSVGQVVHWRSSVVKKTMGLSVPVHLCGAHPEMYYHTLEGYLTPQNFSCCSLENFYNLWGFRSLNTP
jgi:hypothetical protein